MTESCLLCHRRHEGVEGNTMGGDPRVIPQGRLRQSFKLKFLVYGEQSPVCQSFSMRRT